MCLTPTSLAQHHLKFARRGCIVAGTIEGFVTPSDLPVSVRVSIGVLVELSFVFWIVTRGRDAVARGLSGRFGEEPLATAAPLPSA